MSFDIFTGNKQITKTLRFELRPTLFTRKHIDDYGIVSLDELRAEKSAELKKLLDEEYMIIERREAVKAEARKLRRQFLRYKEAEIVYSMQHKKILELADRAGALSLSRRSNSHSRGALRHRKINVGQRLSENHDRNHLPDGPGFCNKKLSSFRNGKTDFFGRNGRKVFFFDCSIVFCGIPVC